MYSEYLYLVLHLTNLKITPKDEIMNSEPMFFKRFLYMYMEETCPEMLSSSEITGLCELLIEGLNWIKHELTLEKTRRQ